jgi:hypothetical protein
LEELFQMRGGLHGHDYGPTVLASASRSMGDHNAS